MNNAQVYSLVEHQARAWEQADLDAIGADFAPDAIFISPGGSWSGPDAIRSAARSFFEKVTAVEVIITRVLYDEEQAQGAVEWTWSETRRADGRRFTVEDAIIFTLRGDTITTWREYFDTSAMK